MKRRPSGQPIRVLIVEDSRAQLELLIGLIKASNHFVIAGTAADGQTAVDAAQRLRPDVIAMDINLPVMDGYEATRQIMRRCPTPVVMVSSSIGDAARRSVEALAAGALAVVRKPGGINSTDFQNDRDTMLTTLRLMADVPVITRFLSRAIPGIPRPVTTTNHWANDVTRSGISQPPLVLAIASSTGGPVAVQTVLNGLGAGFPLPVLIAQHIARGFVTALADWLNSTVPLPVRITAHQERLQPGTVYLAPDDQHLMAVVRGFAGLRPNGPDDRYCPSGDTLFESVSRAYGSQAIGVVLTGMGDDGARGLAMLRSSGGRTLAQDEATSIVYGMPQAAALNGAAARVEALPNIAGAILELVT